MSSPAEEPEDAITAEEIQGTTAPEPTSTSTAQKRPNAFTELMKPKHHKPSTSTEPPKSSTHKHFKDREGLGAYIEKPETFPSSRVISYDHSFVVIHDLYPKSSVHLLLLPRDPTLWFQRPLTILSKDAAFLESVKKEVDKLKNLIAQELRRRFGKDSQSDRAYQGAYETLMTSDDSPPETQSEIDALLPAGRNWHREILAGVHAHPSMSHLHIHILSRDRHSERLKHRKHYNSFNTRFFVPIDDFPLEDDDPRFHPGREGYLAEDMKCWRCGRNFGNKFARLKEHLEEEFEAWKRE